MEPEAVAFLRRVRVGFAFPHCRRLICYKAAWQFVTAATGGVIRDGSKWERGTAYSLQVWLHRLNGATTGETPVPQWGKVSAFALRVTGVWAKSVSLSKIVMIRQRGYVLAVEVSC